MGSGQPDVGPLPLFVRGRGKSAFSRRQVPGGSLEATGGQEPPPARALRDHTAGPRVTENFKLAVDPVISGWSKFRPGPTALWGPHLCGRRLGSQVPSAAAPWASPCARLSPARVQAVGAPRTPAGAPQLRKGVKEPLSLELQQEGEKEKDLGRETFQILPRSRHLVRS